MPIYEFHCEHCGSDSEILVRSSRVTGTQCPHCGSSQLEKKFSTFAASGGEKAASSNARPAKNGGGHGCGGSCSCH